MEIELKSNVKNDWKYLNGPREQWAHEVWELERTEDRLSSAGEPMVLLYLVHEQTQDKETLCVYPRYLQAIAKEWGIKTENWPTGGVIRLVWNGVRMTPIPAGIAVKTERVM